MAPSFPRHSSQAEQGSPGSVPDARRCRPDLSISIPRDFLLGPIFAASPQSQPRSILVGQRLYTIGGADPTDCNRLFPALDSRHARALFVLLSFLDPLRGSAEAQFSIREFCHRSSHTYSGSYAGQLRLLLLDLRTTPIDIRDLSSGQHQHFRILDHFEINGNPALDAKRNHRGQATAWFSQEFASQLALLRDVQSIDLETYTSIRSPLARAVFLFLPSRAHHHDRTRPFGIGLSTLLHQVGHPIPATKRLRCKLFSQRGTSVLSQLEGRQTISGLLRVRLRSLSDGSDGKLLAWVERTRVAAPQRVRAQGKLTKAFLSAGWTQTQLEERLARRIALDAYELELLSLGQIEVEKNLGFLIQARSLLGSAKFHQLLAEAKGDALERRPATKSPTARLIYRIMETIARPIGTMWGKSSTAPPSSGEIQVLDTLQMGKFEYTSGVDNLPNPLSPRALQKRPFRRPLMNNP